ncbi:hypothetical protein [Variovorax sp. J31P207]|uniref:hypothetical protein n=1 Tax=Variovorax sp. J31P207 TaxID=3053510 RepID=UPI00257708AA|nr:hypothetical protein [Variovorax sp. J31P207]MDM0071767.1 hypothetical protein [Variovorax sp. J31P207]
MTTQSQALTESQQDPGFEKKFERLRELFATAPELGKSALEAQIQQLTEAREPLTRMSSAGRIGTRQGKVSELLVIAPFAPGGAQRLRAILDLRNGDFSDTDRVGTVHDMRFVFLEDDTKLLFATAYDGDWDPYIEDFAAKIPAQMDVLFTAFEGWPGIHSGQAVKDWIARHQVPAAGWYVAHPDLTVRDIRRLKRVGEALDEFLDKISS